MYIFIWVIFYTHTNINRYKDTDFYAPMKQEQDVIKRNIQRIQKEPLEIKNISGEIKIIKKSYKFKVEELCKK